MFFCENCNNLSKECFCSNCGNKKVREVQDEDFCFFTDMDVFHAKMFEGFLENNKIEFVFLPIRNCYNNSAFASEAEIRRIFVKYKDSSK